MTSSRRPDDASSTGRFPGPTRQIDSHFESVLWGNVGWWFEFQKSAGRTEARSGLLRARPCCRAATAPAADLFSNDPVLLRRANRSAVDELPPRPSGGRYDALAVYSAALTTFETLTAFDRHYRYRGQVAKVQCAAPGEFRRAPTRRYWRLDPPPATSFTPWFVVPLINGIHGLVRSTSTERQPLARSR